MCTPDPSWYVLVARVGGCCAVIDSTTTVSVLGAFSDSMVCSYRQRVLVLLQVADLRRVARSEEKVYRAFAMKIQSLCVQWHLPTTMPLHLPKLPVVVEPVICWLLP
jgi:hypothetical protein